MAPDCGSRYGPDEELAFDLVVRPLASMTKVIAAVPHSWGTSGLRLTYAWRLPNSSIRPAPATTVRRSLLGALILQVSLFFITFAYIKQLAQAIYSVT